MDKIIKIGLATFLIICLADMPYGYYQLVRFLSLIGFGILAYNANQKDNKNEMLVYIALALLFQPLFKFSLGRTLWNIIDVVVALGLLISVLGSISTNKKQE